MVNAGNIIIAIISALDIFIILNYLSQAKSIRSVNLSYTHILVAYAVWVFRLLLFGYILLFSFNHIVLRILCVLVFVLPHIVFLLKSKNLYINSITNLRFIPITVLSLTFWFYLSIGENTWDGSAYHLPIEQLAAKNGSLFGWEDFIYAQWQQNTFQIGSAFYDVLYKNLAAGSIISVSSFIFLTLLFARFTKMSLVITTIFLLTVPSIFHQIGSRYIDLSVATALFFYFLSLKLFFAIFESKDEIKYRNTIGLVPLILISAIMMGSKSSVLVPAFILLGIVVVQGFTLSASKSLFRLKQRMVPLPLFLFGTILGTFPVFFRNTIEFGNPFYPYKVFFFNNGLFSFDKVSNFLTDFYTQQVGLTTNNFIYNTFYQYLYSPFVIIINSIKEFDLNFMEYLNIMSEKEYIYRTFVYDNRLGGFGILFSLVVLIYIYKFKRQKEILIFLTCFLFFSIAPTSIHPRYYLGIGIIALAVIIQKLERPVLLVNIKSESKYLFPNKKLLVVLLLFSVFWNLVNTASFYSRTKFNPFQEATIDRNSISISKRINPDCIDSIHIGSGLWATTGIFGPNSCSIPFYSLNMGGSLIDVNIGPSTLSTQHLQLIEKIVTDRMDKLLIICTFPKNKQNPCFEINRNLNILNKKTFFEVGSEAKFGPSWSRIIVEGQR